MSAPQETSSPAAAATDAPARAPRPDSDDTIFIGNLPENFTRASLVEWCEANFTTTPDVVRVRKPRVRDGEAPAVRFGFLKFNDPEVAKSTLDLLLDHTTPFTFFGETTIEAKWALAQRERAPRADSDGAAPDGAKKKRRPRKRKGKKDANADGEAAADGAAPAEGGSRRSRGSRKKESADAEPSRRSRGSRKKESADAEPEPEPEPVANRVYAKNFNTEENLREVLGAHGNVTSVELKEVRRGPGAGQSFAFVTFETPEEADAAVAALGTEDPAEGELVIALARPKKVSAKRTRQPREPRENTSIRLEEPSTNDLCCRNLPFTLDDEGLRAIFKDYSSVDSARIITRGTRSRGYGFVHFTDAAETAAAQAALNDQEIGQTTNGQPLLLKLDFALSAPRPILDEAGAAAAAAGAPQ